MPMTTEHEPQVSNRLHLGRRKHDAEQQIPRSELHRTDELFEHHGRRYTVYTLGNTGQRFVYLGEPHLTNLHRVYRA